MRRKVVVYRGGCGGGAQRAAPSADCNCADAEVKHAGRKVKAVLRKKKFVLQETIPPVSITHTSTSKKYPD